MPEHAAAPPLRPYLARLWHAEQPWPRLLWRDMLAIGTAINLACSFGALMLAAQGLATVWAVVLHFSTLPWNLLLFNALRRQPGRPAWALTTGAVWVVLMLVV